MNKHQRLSCVVLLAAMIVGACQKSEGTQVTPEPVKDMAANALRFGVTPSLDAETIRQDYAPFIEEMGRALNRRVELVVPTNYEQLSQLLEENKLEVAQLSAHLALAKRDGHGSSKILARQHMISAAPHRGVFVVGEKSSFTKLSDASGKKIVYVDRASASGYHYPRLKMMQLGLDPEKFFSESSFVGSHDAVVRFVKENKADVGCISEQSLAGSTGLRVLEKTDVIPDDVIVAVSGLSASESEALRLFLLKAKDNTALSVFLNRRGIEAFLPGEESRAAQ